MNQQSIKGNNIPTDSPKITHILTAYKSFSTSNQDRWNLNQAAMNESCRKLLSCFRQRTSTLTVKPLVVIQKLRSRTFFFDKIIQLFVGKSIKRWKLFTCWCVCFHVTRETRTRFPENGSLLLIGQFEERNAELEWAAVSGECRGCEGDWSTFCWRSNVEGLKKEMFFFFVSF